MSECPHSPLSVAARTRSHRQRVRHTRSHSASSSTARREIATAARGPSKTQYPAPVRCEKNPSNSGANIYLTNSIRTISLPPSSSPSRLFRPRSPGGRTPRTSRTRFRDLLDVTHRIVKCVTRAAPPSLPENTYYASVIRYISFELAHVRSVPEWGSAGGGDGTHAHSHVTQMRAYVRAPWVRRDEGGVGGNSNLVPYGNGTRECVCV